VQMCLLDTAASEGTTLSIFAVLMSMAQLPRQRPWKKTALLRRSATSQCICNLVVIIFILSAYKLNYESFE
jgi:hypothetical protein